MTNAWDATELADKINEALAAGHTVIAMVYTRGVKFSPKWAGAFSMGANGNVIFRNGKRKTCFITSGTAWTVVPRKGR